MKFLSILVLVAFLVSCNNSSSSITENTEKPFFDLKEFFEKEIENHKNGTIKKTVKIDTKSETKTLTDFDLVKELELFSNCDINKPSLFDKYKIEGSVERTIYTALKEDLKVQKIEIIKSGDATIEKVIIHKKVETQIYSSEKVLTYQPDIGFTIQNGQKTLISDKKNYEIEVLYQ
jgi:hypothetical protein